MMLHNMGPPPCAAPGGCGCAQIDAETECDEVADQLEDELCQEDAKPEGEKKKCNCPDVTELKSIF